jgi:hypothetical protein
MLFRFCGYLRFVFAAAPEKANRRAGEACQDLIVEEKNSCQAGEFRPFRFLETKKFSFKVAEKARIFVRKGTKIQKGDISWPIGKKDMQFALSAQFSMVKAEALTLDAQDFYQKVKICRKTGSFAAGSGPGQAGYGSQAGRITSPKSIMNINQYVE